VTSLFLPRRNFKGKRWLNRGVLSQKDQNFDQRSENPGFAHSLSLFSGVIFNFLPDWFPLRRTLGMLPPRTQCRTASRRCDKTPNANGKQDGKGVTFPAEVLPFFFSPEGSKPIFWPSGYFATWRMRQRGAAWFGVQRRVATSTHRFSSRRVLSLEPKLNSTYL